MKPQLTIIIPFLNEKEEVANTVRSIREHSSMDDVHILLINDNSDDGYDYQRIAEEFHTEYISNITRMGVASSRNIGVDHVFTPYVMIIDAHMRFYDNRWVDRIVGELQKDERSLLCCQTKGLQVVGDKVVEITGRPLSYGACVNFYTGRLLFECEWIFHENEQDTDLNTVNIPCVLGASYCFSKRYWRYLKGVEGLLSYGNDEPYISLKVYLEGGTCKLLKDVVVGHIYRSIPPYTIEDYTRIYNRLLLSELLLPDDYQSRIYSQTIAYYRLYNYQDALFQLYDNRREICSLKQYYRGIFKHDFSYYEAINLKGGNFAGLVSNRNELLKEIAHHVILNVYSMDGIGLLSGRLGVSLFLFHYGRYVSNVAYIQLAEKILDDVIESIDAHIPFSFFEGLIGVGWTVEYLSQKEFIGGDTSDILEAIDAKVMHVFSPTMENINLDNGLGGIVHYVLARLHSIEKHGNKNPFTPAFIDALYKRVRRVYDCKVRNCDSLEIYLRFIIYYEKLGPIRDLSLYNILYLRFPVCDYIPQKYVLGLDGNSGTGLKLIFESLKSTLPFSNENVEYL